MQIFQLLLMKSSLLPSHLVPLDSLTIKITNAYGHCYLPPIVIIHVALRVVATAV
jgi:hypothetical protein